MKRLGGRIVPRVASLSPEEMDAFVRTRTLRMFFSFTFAFVVGVKLCDAFFFRKETLAVAAEETEEDFWRKTPKPRLLQPTLHPCLRPHLNGQLCPSFILTRLERDLYVPSSISEDLRRFRRWRASE